MIRDRKVQIVLARLKIITVIAFVMLVSGIGSVHASPVPCYVPKAPKININPITQPIEYDYSKSQEELTAMQSSTVNPYAVNVDTATNGLRQDTPVTQMEVSLGSKGYAGDVFCMWYDTINVTIQLQPKIYIAEEFKSGRCHDAILEHEKKHIAVDHEVINKYSQDIGQAILSAVNSAGAMGPYNRYELPEMQDLMVEHIKSAVSSKELFLKEDMRRRQSQIDSLEEYEAVSVICSPEQEKIKRWRKK